jgi:predicted RNase H-like HicB family nuclease
MLTEYIEAAMAQIVIEYDEEGKQYIGEIPACRGVIGVGESEEACRQDTQESLEGWILLGVQDLPFSRVNLHQEIVNSARLKCWRPKNSSPTQPSQPQPRS